MAVSISNCSRKSGYIAKYLFLIFNRLSTELMNSVIILWEVDPFLGNDRKINNYTTAVSRQRPVNSNRGTVFSVWSMPRCYKQGKLGAVSQLTAGVQCCELLLWQTDGWGRRQFGNPEEGERPPLEAATKQRLVKTVTDWEDLVCPVVICEVCGTVSIILTFSYGL
jgi:hypothetical protein